MEKIDIQNFNKYYLNVDGNATVARVGHVNYVIENVNQHLKLIEIDPSITGYSESEVATDFRKNELLTSEISTLQTSAQKTDFYTLNVFMSLNETSTPQDTYIVYLGSFTASGPGSNASIYRFSGNVIGVNSPFGSVSLNYSYSAGAYVNDDSFVQAYQLTEASVFIDYTSATEGDLYALIYTPGVGDNFTGTFTLNIEAGVKKGFTLNYSRS